MGERVERRKSIYRGRIMPSAQEDCYPKCANAVRLGKESI